MGPGLGLALLPAGMDFSARIHRYFHPLEPIDLEGLPRGNLGAQS